jgi:anthranilate phosphoribosyltransferase
MRHAIGPRRELGIRTVFNVLGPLTNPAGAKAQLLGVYDPVLTEIMARVLYDLGSRAAYVVHGHGGVDELTTTGPNRVSHFGLSNGDATHGAFGVVVTETIDPQALGFDLAHPEDLLGGEPEENARITRDVLSGKDHGPRRDVVLLNAAAALHVGGLAEDLEAGIDLAQASLDGGAALRSLEAMTAYTNAV